MQAYFLSKVDLKVKCVCMPTSWEINEDALSAVVSSFRFAKAPDAINGDYIAIKNGNEPLYLGVINSIEGEKGKSSVEIRALPISNIFSRNILLGGVATYIEDFIVNAIVENFVATGDKLLDITYIQALVATQTVLDITPHNENGIYNLDTFLRYVARRHGVFAAFSVTFDKLKVSIEKRSPSSRNIDATVSDVLSLNEVITSECVTKVYVKTAVSVLTFYAFKDGSYGENPAMGMRMLGRVEAVYCENPEDATKAAGDVFSDNQYDHLIEMEIAARSKLIDVSRFRLYDRARVRTKSGVYDTYISAISRTSSEKVAVKFGDARLLLTDKLKGG